MNFQKKKWGFLNYFWSNVKSDLEHEWDEISFGEGKWKFTGIQWRNNKVEKLKENEKKIAELEMSLFKQKLEFEEKSKKNKDLNGVEAKLRGAFFKIFLNLTQKCKVGDQESDRYLEVFSDKGLSMEEVIAEANKFADEGVFN